MTARPTLPVLLTRPAPASDALARALRAEGARVVVAPLMRIVHADALPPLAEALIFTSRNGVAAYRALGGPPGLAAWCVGPATAEDAEAAGLDVMGSAPDGASLIGVIPKGAPRLLHLCGAIRRVDIAAALRARGLQAEHAVIYRQDALPLATEARALLEEGPALVPLYSPRSAALFVAACPPELRARARCLALSPAVAAELPEPPEAIAERPDGRAMRALLSERLARSAVEGKMR